MGKQDKSPNLWIVILILLPPIGMNLWKFAARGYSLFEIWPHLLLDASVISLLLALIVWNPFEYRIIYGALYALFCAAYIGNFWPQDIFEWFGTIVALSIFAFVFPRLSLITPWVLLGLLLSYIFVLRIYLPETNRLEALEVIHTHNPGKTAAGFLHDTFNYQRNFLGREKYRYYISRSPGYSDRLRSAGNLHDLVYPSLQNQGISFLYWNEMRFTVNQSGESITARFPGGILEGVTIEKHEAGYRFSCRAMVNPFEMELVKENDGAYSVSRLPASIEVKFLEKMPPQPIR